VNTAVTEKIVMPTAISTHCEERGLVFLVVERVSVVLGIRFVLRVGAGDRRVEIVGDADEVDLVVLRRGVRCGDRVSALRVDLQLGEMQHGLGILHILLVALEVERLGLRVIVLRLGARIGALAAVERALEGGVRGSDGDDTQEDHHHEFDIAEQRREAGGLLWRAFDGRGDGVVHDGPREESVGAKRACSPSRRLSRRQPIPLAP